MGNKIPTWKNYEKRNIKDDNDWDQLKKIAILRHASSE